MYAVIGCQDHIGDQVADLWAGFMTRRSVSWFEVLLPVELWLVLAYLLLLDFCQALKNVALWLLHQLEGQCAVHVL